MERMVKEVMLPIERMLTLNENETIEDVVARLARNGISSAPLMCRTKGLAFVDVLDLLAYLIKVCTTPIERESTQGGESHGLTVDDMATLIKRSKEFLLSHVRDVIAASKRNHYVAIQENDTIEHAVRLMVDGGLHRLAVENHEGKLVGMLPQSHVIKMLIPDINRTDGIGHMKVKDVAMTTTIKGVSPHTAAIDAFIIMHQENLSSLAIIDDQGHLVDNLSASDLKGIAFEANLKSLTKPLPEFFHERELLSFKRRQLVTVSPETSFVDMLRKMKAEEVHRVYVVEEGAGIRKPIGVISFTDVFRQLTKSH